MLELRRCLEKVIGISHYSITFAGDVPNILNRWLVKSELADGRDPAGLEPCLDQTNTRILLEHELGCLPEEELKSNWRFYIVEDWTTAHLFNWPEKNFRDGRDRYVYSLCNVYCEEEKDILLYVNSITPLKMWINGRLVLTGSYEFHSKPCLFIYRFKKGFNTVLVEKWLLKKNETLNMSLDNYMIILKPCDYLADSKLHRFFDQELLQDIMNSYTISAGSAFYQAGQKIDLVVLPGYVSGDAEEDIRITVFTAGGEEVGNTVARTSERVWLEPETGREINGVLGIKALSLEEPAKFSVTYVFYGRFIEKMNALITCAQERSDSNPDIIDTIKKIHQIPDVDNGRINGSTDLLVERLRYPLFEKLFEFERYVYSCDDVLKKSLFSVFRTNALLFKDSEIDEGSTAYSIYLPQEYDTRRKYPLAIFVQYGFGMSRYPFVQRYVQRQHFKEAVVLNLCGRGGINRDYINEASMLDIISKVVETLNIDRNRIYIFGSCTGALAAFGMALRQPGLFTAIACISGTPRLDINHPQYDYLKNLDNTMVYQLCSIQDYFYSCSRLLDTLNYFKKTRHWAYRNFGHDDVDELLNQGKLLKELIRERMDKYPKEIQYTTYEPIYNKSYWLKVEYMEDLNNKSVIKGRIESGSQIDVQVENIRCFSMLISTRHMELLKNIMLNIDGVEQEVHLYRYSRVRVALYASRPEVKVEKLTREAFCREYDHIGIHEDAMGIKQVYFRKCIIVKPACYRYNIKSFVKMLPRILRQPMKERNRNYNYEVFMEDEVDCGTLRKSNFIHIIDTRNRSDIQKELLQRLELNIGAGGMKYKSREYTGDYFALVKCPNPFNSSKQALIVAYNSDAVEDELSRFLLSFDSDPLFYSDTVIYNNGAYYSFRNKDFTGWGSGESAPDNEREE